MTRRYAITIESDDPAELVGILRQLTDAQLAAISVSTPAPIHQPIASQVAGGVNQCSGGHGVMRLIPGGTARSGPRMGQPYPAFWKCDTCGERRDAA